MTRQIKKKVFATHLHTIAQRIHSSILKSRKHAQLVSLVFFVYKKKLPGKGTIHIFVIKQNFYFAVLEYNINYKNKKKIVMERVPLSRAASGVHHQCEDTFSEALISALLLLAMNVLLSV